MPANFGFTSKAQYSPKEGQHYKVYSPGLGGWVTRHQQKSDKTAAKGTEQTISTKIPLEYHIAGCAIEVTSVNYEVDATYGPDAWDHDLDHAGGLAIVGTAPAMTSNGTEQRGLCTWLFQISTEKAKKGEIKKILSCSAADRDWNVPANYRASRKPGKSISREEIKGKEIQLTLRLSNREESSMNNRWIETNQGWLPCQGTKKSDRCQTPPIFKKFRVGGRECTVYPKTQ